MKEYHPTKSGITGWRITIPKEAEPPAPVYYFQKLEDGTLQYAPKPFEATTAAIQKEDREIASNNIPKCTMIGMLGDCKGSHHYCECTDLRVLNKCPEGYDKYGNVIK